MSEKTKERFTPSKMVTSIEEVLKARDEKIILYTHHYRDIIPKAICNMSIEHVDFLIKTKKLYYFNREEQKEFLKKQNESI